MKKMLSILLVVITLLMSFSMVTTAIEDDMFLEPIDGYMLSHEGPQGMTCDEGIFIDSYIGDKTDVVIPTEIKGQKIVGINVGAFEGNEKIKAVIIPKSVRHIGAYAFDSCTNLEQIAIINEATVIGEDAFADTAYYNNEANWENGVLYIARHLISAKQDMPTKCIIKDGTVSIAEDSFKNNSSVKEVVMPDTVIFINDRAFCNCSLLEKVTLSEETEYIGWSAFSRCKKLKSVVIPESVRDIHGYAFNSCTSLKNIKIEGSDITIDLEAFTDTSYYNTASNWDKGILYVDNHLVETDRKIVKGDCKIKEGTKTISPNAFRECDGLTSVTIPASVKIIGDSAFYTCNALEKISISDNVEEIGSYAFGYTAYYNNKDNWENGVLYLGKYLINVDEENFKEKDYEVKEGTKVIATFGMSDSNMLENLVIPDSVVAINDRAFAYSENLKTVTIPDSVKYIGKDVFEGCGDIAIEAHASSPAGEYAKTNGFRFIPLTCAPLLEYEEDKEVPTDAKDESTTEKTVEDVVGGEETTKNDEISEMDDCEIEIVEKPTKPEKVDTATYGKKFALGVIASLVVVLTTGVALAIYKKRKS